MVIGALDKPRGKPKPVATRRGRLSRAPRRNARGELARTRIKEAAARVLERVGYRQMRVTDVTAEAGVAAGLFYHYFPDLKTLTIEVLRDFMTRFEAIDQIEAGVERGDWFARSLAHNRLVVQSYARSPGIMRCMVQMGDEAPEFAEIWRTSYYRRLELLVRALPRLFPGADFTAAEARLVTTLLAGIGEHLLAEYYIARVPSLRELALDEDQMAEWVTVMFHRALFLENPPAARLRHAGKLTGMKRVPRGARAVEPETTEARGP
jgi:AcrR family transcriptional regulator